MSHHRHPRRFNKSAHDHDGIIGTQSKPAAWDEGTLFAQPALQVSTAALHGLTRASDPIEAQVAATKHLEGRTAIQAKILGILAECGPLNAEELERRIEFRHLAPSTVRKRVSELKQAGDIEQVGRKNGMAQWDVAAH